MLDRPFAAIRAEVGKIFGSLIVVIILLALLFGFIFLDGIWQTGWMVGQTDKITHKVNTWHEVIVTSRDLSFGTVALVALALIVVPARAMVLEWSRIGNSLAVMLGFVALSFFSADSWHTAGTIPWWRLIILVAVFSLLAFPVLYRQASRAVKGELKPPISTVGMAGSVSDPLVKAMVTDAADLRPTLEIPRHALVNLRFIAALLLSRRILLGGIIVSAALFLLGIIVIGQQGTLNLMDTNSVAAIGFTKTFGIGSYQFFLSEPLLKVSLLLGVIAAAYFVFANPDPDDCIDLVIPKFIRKMIAMWACYVFLTEIPGQPEIDATAEFTAWAGRSPSG
jgi:hypothetical protein